MEKKDFILIGLLPILLVLIIFLLNSPQITGFAIVQPTLQNIGTYSISPSFKARTGYSLNEYNEIINSFDEIKKCSMNNDIKACTEKQTTDKFEWQIDCDKGQEYVLHDFSRFLEECINSVDSNCVCRKNLAIAGDEIKKHELFSTLENFKASTYKLNMMQNDDEGLVKISVVDPSTKKELNYEFESDAIGWIPKNYLIGYTQTEFHSVNMFFKDDLKAPGPLMQLTIYKYADVNGKTNVDFVKEEGDKFIYPNSAKNKPADIKDCRIEDKRMFKFCVISKKSNYSAYDFLDNKIKDRNAVLKFAAYIPKNVKIVEGKP